MTTSRLIEHFFRHEYGKLVAVLSRRVGVQHVEAVEDAVQSALMTALHSWTAGALPNNPSAWVFRVARNNLVGELRQQIGRNNLLARDLLQAPVAEDGPDCYLPGEVEDGMLQMLFACCDDNIPVQSQLVLALKTLCGFSVSEIALRLLTSEDNVYKRFSRARDRLKQFWGKSGEFTTPQLSQRLPSVHKIVYLLFTEGYLSSHAEFAIRRELCEEAIRLGLILAKHPVGETPETHALLALMHLHMARIEARQDGAGGLLLLEEQDRSRWDQQKIKEGLYWLAKSAEGDHFSQYHAEAGIAAEHCLGPSFEETRWQRVVECYSLLEQISDSPIHKLNRAVAVAQWQGPAAGLEVIRGFEPPAALAASYLWAAVLSDLHRRCGHSREAERYRLSALSLAPNPALRQMLQRRLSVNQLG